MIGRSNRGGRRLACQLFIGTAIGAGVLWATSQAASAATTATFNAGVLSVFGDNADSNVTISRDAAGTILVNGGAVPVAGGTPTVANTALIQVFGQGGNDVITSQRGERRPAAGQPVRRRRQRHPHRRFRRRPVLRPGRQRHPARQRRHRTCCSAAPRTTSSPAATPTTRRSARPATTGWSGTRATTPTSTRAGRASTPSRSTAATAPRCSRRRPTALRVRFDRVDPAPFAIDIGTSENLVLNANGGNDSFSATGNLAASDQDHGRWRGRQRHDPRQQRDRPPDRRRRQRLHRRAAGQRRRPVSAPATTRSSGTRATAATSSRARPAPTRCCSTAVPPTRSSRPRPTAGGCASPATSATS